jgi:GxxExxY protein
VKSGINYVSGQVIDAAMKVHSRLGPGRLESADATCLAYELRSEDFELQRRPLPIVYDDGHLDAGYRMDMLVEGAVLVELKAIQKFAPVHTAQVLSYLKLSDRRVGLLINFHVVHLRHGIKGIANSARD